MKRCTFYSLLTIIILVINSNCYKEHCDNYKSYHDKESGIVSTEGCLCDSLEQGVWKTYYKNGKIRSLCTYNKGLLNDSCVYTLESEQKRIVHWRLHEQNDRGIKICYPDSWKVECEIEKTIFVIHDDPSDDRKISSLVVVENDSISVDEYRAAEYKKFKEKYDLISYSFFEFVQDDKRKYYLSEAVIFHEGEELMVYNFSGPNKSGGVIGISLSTLVSDFEFKYMLFTSMINSFYIDKARFFNPYNEATFNN